MLAEKGLSSKPSMVYRTRARLRIPGTRHLQTGPPDAGITRAPASLSRVSSPSKSRYRPEVMAYEKQHNHLGCVIAHVQHDAGCQQSCDASRQREHKPYTRIRKAWFHAP